MSPGKDFRGDADTYRNTAMGPGKDLQGLHRIDMDMDTQFNSLVDLFHRYTVGGVDDVFRSETGQ